MTSESAGRDWLSLEDGTGSTWLFDTGFLLSNYNCIYGAGCRSIDVEPDPTGAIGCCVHGAHFVDADDRRRTERLAAQLTADEWQFAATARQRGGPSKKDKSGDWVTRKVKGACIFLNRADFGGGAGCALHLAALRRGERPIDWKPSVCWQVPIRLDVHTDEWGYETILVRAWERRDWGPGGEEFNWWCTESDEAYTATEPVYRNARDELVELMGRALYRRLVERLEQLEVGPTETPVSIH
ncbi:MAG: hypothetical protein ACFCVK_07195 [Acidimicrobiales bacterium]